MTALTDLIGLGDDLNPTPNFPVQPKDKGRASEANRQAAFRAMLPKSVISWGVPNAGKRGYKAQRRAKSEGLTAGVFDEHYAWNHGFACLEWKSGTGDLSPAQIEWGNAMVERGFCVACVRTPEFALALMREWGAISSK